MFNTYICMNYLDEKTDETIQTGEASGNATDSAQKNSEQSDQNQTGDLDDTDVSKQTDDSVDPNVSDKTDDLDYPNASNHPDDLDDRIISNQTDDLDDTVSYLNLS